MSNPRWLARVTFVIPAGVNGGADANQRHGDEQPADCVEITKEAFVQEHFANAGQPESGVVIMNLHKAKGKQFDETILFEDMPIFARGRGIVRNSGRFVRANEAGDNLAQYRKNFRMAVTRSKYRTIVLTPNQDKCILISDLM